MRRLWFLVLLSALVLPEAALARTGGGSSLRADGPKPAGSFSLFDLWSDDGSEACADAVGGEPCVTTARRLAS